MTNKGGDRLWFLDNVRYSTVLAVVVLHVGMSQTTFPWDWSFRCSAPMCCPSWQGSLCRGFDLDRPSKGPARFEPNPRLKLKPRPKLSRRRSE